MMAFFLRFEYADDLIKVLDPSRNTNKIGCPEVLKTRAPKNCNCPRSRYQTILQYFRLHLTLDFIKLDQVANFYYEMYL